MTACEAYIELLNELQVPKAHILAMSAGGPSGIYLASRYPNRVKVLSCNPPSPLAGCLLAIRRTAARIMFRPSAEKYVWATLRCMNKFAPGVLLNSMIPSFSKLPKEKVLPLISGEDRRQSSKT
ncbi:alpha/beta hydrolase [Paenibacillus sp. JTLBN-2024]